jgi:predicted DNA-binding ArsR family transcriptional regulator
MEAELVSLTLPVATAIQQDVMRGRWAQFCFRHKKSETIGKRGHPSVTMLNSLESQWIDRRTRGGGRPLKCP